MTDRELMQQALTQLEYAMRYWDFRHIVTALRERLARCDDCGEANPADIHTCSPQRLAWEKVENIGATRYKVVPSHHSMFHRFAVVAGDGTHQVYLGREVECMNMAAKLRGAFLDGAFLYQELASKQHADTHPPRREWVGLTEEDMVMCESEEDVRFARAIEAKLREKNA